MPDLHTVVFERALTAIPQSAACAARSPASCVSVRRVAYAYRSATREIATKRENLTDEKAASVAGELKACAEIIADTDRRMQALHDVIHRSAAP
jgi:protein involved in temperature-dependent protein secretion